MSKALLIIDVQNDFVEGGSLAVAGGLKAAQDLAALITAPNFRDTYQVLAVTQDWHVDPGTHWSAEPDFVDTWPVHCAAGTSGAEFAPPLKEALQVAGVDVAIKKGRFEAAYSGFEGLTEQAATLTEALRALGVTEIDVVGIAADYCVAASALDAAAAGFKVNFLTAYAPGINQDRVNNFLNEVFPEAGIAVIRG